MKLPPLPGLLWILLLWALFYASQGVFAQEAKAAEKSAGQPDMRVLIDVSGSMKKTDPNNLRVPAVKLLLQLAKDQSQLGIWMFGEGVNVLVPSATVSADWKKSAVGKVNAIHSRGLFTHIGAALEAASKGQTKPDPKWDRSIVLLSDGMVDISKDPAVSAREKKRILEQLVPKLKAAGIHVRTVALSDQADHDFLRTLAVQTGGSFVVARNADELLKAFVTTSDKVNLPEQVPLEGDTFAIDESVKEFTVLIFRKPGGKRTELIAPDGQKFSLSNGSRNVSWFADQLYDLVTVYNPVAGKWKVAGDLDPSNRVTVVSDLEVNVQGLPDGVLEGEKITMNLQMEERGRVIANPNFLELMDITFSQQTASGETYEGKLSRNPDGTPNVPADGIYSAKLGRTLTEGEHTFTVLVDGKTFKRKKQHRVMVYRDVLDIKTDYRDDNGQVVQILTAEPRAGMVNNESIELVAEIRNPKGESSLHPVKPSASARWQIEVPPGPTLGVYEVMLKVKGNSASGRPFELTQGPYTVDYSPLGLSAEKVAPKSGAAPVTFDDSALDVPSLDVEELPPDDMEVPPEAAADTVAAAAPPAEPEHDLPAEAEHPAEAAAEPPAEEAGGWQTGWLSLASLFILGNVAIVGVGVFFYLRFLRRTDAEQQQVVEDIVQLKQRQQEKSSAPVAEPAPPEISSVELPGIELEEMPALEAELPAMDAVPDEATVIRTSEPEPVVEEPVVAVAPPAAVPDPAYVMQAAPLELEDDEMIEVDDDFDVEIQEEESEGLDDLEMMLNEQEEASETSINRTIDAMLEQPTVYPGSDKAQKEKEEADRRFAEDEFMLDNPVTKK